MKRYKLLSPLLSLLLGALAALPMVVKNIPLLSFVLFAPFFYMLRTAKNKKPSWYYTNGLFFFQGYLMVAFSFFVSMYPLDFTGIEGFAGILVILCCTVLLPLFQGCALALST